MSLNEFLIRNQGKGQLSWKQVAKQFSTTPDAARMRWKRILKGTPTYENYTMSVSLNSSEQRKIDEVKNYVDQNKPSKNVLKIVPNENLVLKSKWQNAKGDWLHSYENKKDGGLNKEDYQEIINNLEYKVTKLKTKSRPITGQQLISISDVHLGMSTKGGLFDLDWCVEEFYKRLDIVIEKALPNRIVTLCILGDYTDGFEGKTARGGHKLPQNMNDREMFKHGLEGLTYLIDGIAKKSKVTCHFLCNSNHPGVTDFTIAEAFSNIVPLRYDNVEFLHHEDFIVPIKVANTEYLITHGYDEKFMMKGMPRMLTPAHVDKIRNIVEHYNLKYPTLLRGDQHQYSDVDYEHFRDIMCPALSNPSGWVQTNFMTKNRGGFLTGIYTSTPSYTYNKF